VHGVFLQVILFLTVLGASDPNSKDFTPIESSHGNYTFEDQDKSIITKIRGWLKIFFKNPESIKYNYQIKLSERFKATFDFDIMVKILEKKEDKDDIIFTLMDDSDMYFNYLIK